MRKVLFDEVADDGVSTDDPDNWLLIATPGPKIEGPEGVEGCAILSILHPIILRTVLCEVELCTDMMGSLDLGKW